MTRPPEHSWLLFQLADGTFPSGGFAHSGGLEAAMVFGSTGPRGHGDGKVMPEFLDASLHQIGRATLPFVRDAARDPSRLAAIDVAYDATIPLRGANHASRAQGRALAGAAARIWEGKEIGDVALHAQSGPAHHGPVFGAVFGALGLTTDDALAAYLHAAARGLLSAGVRLGLLGPLEAQRMLADRAPLFSTLLGRAREADHEDAAQTAPLIELFAALHDRLDGRMFQS